MQTLRTPLTWDPDVSMESGLEGRNNDETRTLIVGAKQSQWSPA